MSVRLIKPGDDSGRQVRPMGSPRADVDDPLAAHRLRITDLERDLLEHDRTIAGFPLLKDAAFKAGWAKGREDGLNEAQGREADRVAAVSAGIKEALGRFDTRLTEMEALAAALSRDCLERMLGTADDLAPVVARMLATQLQCLQTATSVEVEVARSDFPDEATLEALAAQTGRDRVTVRAVEGLPAGACIIRLDLGRTSVGLDQQWPVLRSTLERLAGGDNS